MNNGDENEEKEWLITFPVNVEFIQISNFSNTSNYLLNFNECKNMLRFYSKIQKYFNGIYRVFTQTISN